MSLNPADYLPSGRQYSCMHKMDVGMIPGDAFQATRREQEDSQESMDVVVAFPAISRMQLINGKMKGKRKPVMLSQNVIESEEEEEEEMLLINGKMKGKRKPVMLSQNVIESEEEEEEEEEMQLINGKMKGKRKPVILSQNVIESEEEEEEEEYDADDEMEEEYDDNADDEMEEEYDDDEDDDEEEEEDDDDQEEEEDEEDDDEDEEEFGHWRVVYLRQLIALVKEGTALGLEEEPITMIPNPFFMDLLF